MTITSVAAPKRLVELSIDGSAVSVTAGSTILDACRRIGIDTPTLCYDDTLIKDTRLNPICRGGSFKTADPMAMYCAYRHEDPTDGRFDCIGFRVALSLG